MEAEVVDVVDVVSWLLEQPLMPMASAASAMIARYFMVCVSPPFSAGCRLAECRAAPPPQARSRWIAHAPAPANGSPMSDQEPPPPPLGIILGVILAVDALILAFLASRGMLARLSPGAQFYYGLMTFGFPVLVYFFLKRRRDRRDGE